MIISTKLQLSARYLQAVGSCYVLQIHWWCKFSLKLVFSYTSGIYSFAGAIDECYASGFYHIMITDCIDRWLEMILMMTCHLKQVAPLFSGQHHNHDLHTYVLINWLVYHFDKAIAGNNCAHLTLTADHGATWLKFTQKNVQEASKKMRMRIPYGNMPNN